MSDLILLPAWRLNDAKITSDALALWSKFDVIPPDVMETRIPELVALAYLQDQAVAVASAGLLYIPRLRARFAMYRTFVVPEARRALIGRRLAVFSRDLLEKWSAENPTEQIQGMGASIQATEYQERQRNPIWPELGLNLNFVGYMPDGTQLRISWFRHARL